MSNVSETVIVALILFSLIGLVILYRSLKKDTKEDKPLISGVLLSSIPTPIEPPVTKQYVDDNSPSWKEIQPCREREHIWTDPYVYENGAVRVVDSYCTVCGMRAKGSGQ